MNPPSIATVLLLAAHPDDEIAGAGGWAWRHPGPLAVAFLTDGVPRDPRYFAPGFSNPERYRATRRREAEAVWRRHPQRPRLAFAPFADQELAFALPAADAWLQQCIQRTSPHALLAPAFEGGHPDHDAANLLAAIAAFRHGLAVYEYALYRASRGAVVWQSFSAAPAKPLPPELARRKRRLLARYVSQAEVLRHVDPAREAIRALPAHNYAAPPAPTAYGLWGWPISPERVAAAMAHFARSHLPLPASVPCAS